MSVFAVILAGGQGSRLGDVRKADLRIGGLSIIERVAARLGGVEHPVLVSTGSGPHGTSHGGIEVPDLDLPIGGPLAGIVAAANYLANRAEADAVLVSVAVDTPFLPEDYVPRLLDALAHGSRAAQAGWRGILYPTNAAWRVADLVDIGARIAQRSGHDSPKALLRALEAGTVDWSDSHSQDPFANLNTLTDLTALARRTAVGEQ